MSVTPNHTHLANIDLISMDAMFQSTPSCLKVISRDGLLLHMNPRGLSLIEADDMSSVYRANVYDLVDKAHRQSFIEFNKRVCDGHKESLIFEIVGLRGRRRWMESYAAPYVLTDGDIAHIAITNDITEKIEAEKEISSQKIALANSARLASLGQFVGGIAHEINNPLAIMAGKLSLLELSLERGDFEENAFLEQLREVLDTTERISLIIRNLKTFSRDPGTDDFRSHNLSEIVSETLTLCSENFRLSDIDVTCNIDSGIEIFCQKVQVSQVLMNLLNNAFDEISMHAQKWISIESQQGSSGVSVRVTDSGKGISEEILDRIFDPFFTTKALGEGTGLGLSISTTILTRHGGKLYCNSACPNTQFVLEFPVPAGGT